MTFGALCIHIKLKIYVLKFMDFKNSIVRQKKRLHLKHFIFYCAKTRIKMVRDEKGVEKQFWVQLRSIIQYQCLFVFIGGEKSVRALK
jgi:hypothetical protein